jgi:hypothetical protein
MSEPGVVPELLAMTLTAVRKGSVMNVVFLVAEITAIAHAGKLAVCRVAFFALK